MREINSHKVNGCNEAITITVLDEPGHGGASHHYLASASKGTFLPDAGLPPKKKPTAIKKMVDRFLSWPLPKSVQPDACVMDRDYPYRVGTNLLTAIEAQSMLEHVLEETTATEGDDGYVRCEVRFQNGPIGEVGTNGVTNEALLAIVIDRLQSFQRGPYACRENALALTKLEEGAHWLQHRTRERVARGVEGTHEK